MILVRKFLLWLGFHGVLFATYGLVEGLHRQPQMLALLLFFASQSLVLLAWRTEGPRFAIRIWSTWLFRMLSSMAFLLLMFWRGLSEPVSFTLHFAALYLLYLFFDLLVSLRKLRRHEKTPGT